MSKLFNDLPVFIFPQEVFRYLGYSEKRSMLSGNIERAIYNTIQEYRPLIKADAVVETLPVTFENATIHIKGTDFIISAADVVEKFAGSEFISFIAVTLGKTLEELTSQLFAQDEYTQAVILDAICTDGVEQATNYLNDLLRQEAYQQGYQLTQRYSPGYGQWHVENQAQILSILNAEQLDITMTEGYMLNPQKTITAIIGWKPFGCDLFMPEEDKCAQCNLENCQFR